MGMTLEEIRRIQDERGIEFYFAQFVDLYGKPNAKLIPAAHLDDLVSDGAGFAGFAAGSSGRSPPIRTSPRCPTWRASRPYRGSKTSPASRAT